MSIATLPKREQPDAPDTLATDAILASEREIAGYVYDPAAPETRFVVELLLDGYPARIARADIFDPALQARDRGDGCYRFVFALDAETLGGARIAEVRVANGGALVGAPLDLPDVQIAPAARPAGEARWAGGLRIRGWIPWDPKTVGRVRALH